MLKVFQLRTARSVLGLGVRDIGVYIDLSRSTISKIERRDLNSTLNITQEQNVTLIKIFNDKGVFFPDKNTISYGNTHRAYSQFLTRFQLRGSRAILALSQRELSGSLCIEKNILNYLENLSNDSYIATTEEYQLIINSKLKNYFNKKNISFPNDYTISVNFNGASPQGNCMKDQIQK